MWSFFPLWFQSNANAASLRSWRLYLPIPSPLSPVVCKEVYTLLKTPLVFLRMKKVPLPRPVQREVVLATRRVVVKGEDAVVGAI